MAQTYNLLNCICKKEYKYFNYLPTIKKLLMDYLLFILYLLLFCWVITRLNFFKNSGIASNVLIILFLIRIASGFINSYINLYHYSVSDVTEFHKEGIAEYYLLIHNPREYLTNIFHNSYPTYSGFLETTNSFWNDLRSNMIAKILSIFNVFSHRNFFINTLFFNFLMFFGAIYFYRVFIKIFPSYKKAIIACVFLLPSVIFFTSGIHRDGFIYLSLSMVIYNVYYMVERKTFPWKKALGVILCLCFILLLRNFVFITLVPALVAWIIATRFPRYSLITFISLYVLMACFFFISSTISPRFDLPADVSSRQVAFIKISKWGASAININPLYPNFKSFLNNAPQALNHSLMRPYLTEKFTLLYFPVALEIFVYEILFLLFVFFKRNNRGGPFVYFCIFFSLSMFLLIGYTIPIIGAITRYRSIYFPFLVIPLICLTDWQKVLKLRYINKKNM